MRPSDQTDLITPDTTKEEPAPPVALSLPVDTPPEQHKRSLGLKLFDVGLYPLITNVGVFAISVAATYLTTKGGEKDAAGKLVYGKTGEFFQKRGDWLVSKFKNMGMSEKSADMSKMVFFSFADGSLLAPVVKMFEDRREKIGKWVDSKLGTTPDDPEVYKSEPKQSWGSVLGGRAATAVTVVSTAVALDKTGLNDKLFREPGIKMGEWIKSKPNLAKKFGKLDVGEISKVSLFEGFYTSVCTAGLYFSSRFIARKFNKHEEMHKTEAVTLPAPLPVDATADAKNEQETPIVRTFAHEGLKPTRRETVGSSHVQRVENRPLEGVQIGA